MVSVHCLMAITISSSPFLRQSEINVYKQDGDTVIETRYSRMNHIEYDDDAYKEIMLKLIDIGDNSIEEVNTCCDNVNDMINSMNPDKYTSNTDEIKNSIQNELKEIRDLATTINYALLAYDACDRALKENVDKYIIDSLFDDADLSTIIRNDINPFTEDRNNDGIFEYNLNTNFTQFGEQLLDNVEDSINILNNLSDILDTYGLDYEKIGYSREKVEEELLYICHKRGGTEVYKILEALENNRPNNYSDFSFNPSAPLHDASYYNFSTERIGDYSVLSEMINVNGFDIEFTQVLPSDYTDIERLVFDYTKANTINTLSYLPNDFLSCIINNNNAVVLTCDRNSQRDNSEWGGYYLDDTNVSCSGIIVIDANGALYAKDYYTRDTVIHELAHKFDDSLNGTDDASYLYTLASDEGYKKWNLYREKYCDILPFLVELGYNSDFLHEEYNTHEFFAEAVVTYYLARDELERLCPDVYAELYSMLPEPSQFSQVEKVAFLQDSDDTKGIIGGED